tara:strand:+ start:24 stop:665 length:642 start_codon:yes stop_codon:yes gene_type:complete
MKIHKEGKKILRTEIIVYLLIGLITLFNHSFFYYITPVFLLIFLFSLFFFRIPYRIFEKEEDVAYAPCDGKIVVIEETIENEFYNDKRIQVSIFMSPLNIHNNLFPISGKITYKKYHPGKFLFAWNPKASTNNERNTVVIENNKISVLCRQIAGALARRIVCYPKLEQTVSTCEELGFIKFGSRVDLFFPIGTNIEATLGQITKGGKSIIAKY